MSEHVIDTTDGLLGDAVDLRALFGPRLREELIRCGECRFFKEPCSDNGWNSECVEDEDSPRHIVPSGFCSWGERRADQ